MEKLNPATNSDNFDRLFEEAPSAEEFDQLFEQSPIDQQKTPSILSKIAQTGGNLAQSTGELAQAGIEEYATPIALGAAQGATLGFADEIAARINQAVDPLISKLSGEEAVNKQLEAQGFKIQEEPTTYEKELERVRGMYKEAEETSPWLYGGAQLGASIPSGNVLGSALGVGKAVEGAGKLARIGAEAAKAAPGIALEAYGQSEGSLFGPEASREQAIGDIAVGAGIGALAGGGIQAVSDIAVPAIQKGTEPVRKAIEEYVGDSPFIRQLQKAYQKYGVEYGVSPTSEKAIQYGVPGIEGGTPFSELNLKRAGELTGDLERNRQILGKNVEQSLTDNIDIKLDFSTPVSNFAKSFDEVRRTLPSIGQDPKVVDILNQLSSINYSSLNPVQAKSLMTDLSNIIERNASYKYSSMEVNELNKLLNSFRSNVDNLLKEQVPDYAKSASDYSQFMKTFYEQPIAGKYAPEMSNLFFGNLKDGDLKLTKAYEKLIEEISNQSAEAAQTSFAKLSGAINKLEQQGVPIDFNSKDFLNKLKDYSDDAAIRRGVTKTQESQAGIDYATRKTMGTGETGKAYSLITAQRLGKATRPIRKTAKYLYNAPKESIMPLANKLENTKGLEFLGKSLKEALENDDMYKRNVTLFSILNNPSAKLLIDSEDGMEE